MSFFHVWMVAYHHFKKLPIKFFFIKRVFSLMFYKIDLGVLKFKSPLQKSKLNLLN
jgi:hypothetical protein